jgi:predicted NAD/FAD-binding protein
MRFWHNHGFLGLDTQHPWRTVEGGSRSYVEKLSAPFRDRIHRGAGVRAVTDGGQVILHDGTTHSFDRIVIAAHGDQALRMADAPTPLERDLLGAFHYQDNEAVVHTDRSVMPRTPRCWASWNYTIDGRSHSTHYWMNSLQGVSQRQDYFVSINPGKLDEAKVIRRMAYEHPLFDLAAIAAQSRLPELHAAGDTTGRYYCGAWQRYGFHEDGLWSAARLCAHLLGKDPWP